MVAWGGSFLLGRKWYKKAEIKKKKKKGEVGKG